MSQLEFVLHGVSFPVSSLVARQVCDALAHDQRFPVDSNVTADVLRLFISAIEGDVIELTNENIGGLSDLCEKFEFKSLLHRVRMFKETPTHRLARLEERFSKLETDVVTLQNGVIAALQSDVERLHGHIDSLECSATTQRDVIGTLALLESEVRRLKDYTVPLRSLIVSDFPDIFTEFDGKRFSLLWRGSRDGFGAVDFHNRCDGHANNLTVILDTNGNIFGGFTPVAWGSKTGYIGDPSVKSFLFTLKNPHNVRARRFALNPEMKHLAIYWDSGWGPRFYDFSVSNNCNTNTVSYSFNLGKGYTNDTGKDGTTFLTGSRNFQVKEIEVFEITA
jgi:uncharacterized coiled-coil protein SlyX